MNRKNIYGLNLMYCLFWRGGSRNSITFRRLVLVLVPRRCSCWTPDADDTGRQSVSQSLKQFVVSMLHVFLRVISVSISVIARVHTFPGGHLPILFRLPYAACVCFDFVTCSRKKMMMCCCDFDNLPWMVRDSWRTLMTTTRIDQSKCARWRMWHYQRGKWEGKVQILGLSFSFH